MMPTNAQPNPQQAAQPQGAAAQLPPGLMDAFQRVVLAGLKVMYAPQTRQMLMDGLSKQQPISDMVAQEIAGLMRLLDDKAQHKIPRQVIIPAAVMLMQDLFKFVAEIGLARPTADDAKQALQKLVLALAQSYAQTGLNPPATPQQQPQPPQGAPQPGAQPQPQPTGMIGA